MVSVVIPVFNEQNTIGPLLSRTAEIMDRLGRTYEIVCVDDGSTDRTHEFVLAKAEKIPVVECVRLARNFGQTAALMAGVEHAGGSVIVTMDGDGQNDPEDIPNLLEKLDEGFDVVSGWRANRQDRMDRVVVSRIANAIVSAISKVKLNDYGCALKAYRREVLANVRLYGELHRFIPVFSSWEGGRIAEIRVKHHPRRHGRSHYGYARIFKVALDLVLIRYLHQYLHRPMHLFGGVGITFLIGALGAGIYACWLKFVDGTPFINTPMPLVTIVLGAIGIISLLMGLLSEIVVRTYFESQNRRPYVLRPALPESLPQAEQSKNVRD